MKLCSAQMAQHLLFLLFTLVTWESLELLLGFLLSLARGHDGKMRVLSVVKWD